MARRRRPTPIRILTTAQVWDAFYGQNVRRSPFAFGNATTVSLVHSCDATTVTVTNFDDVRGATIVVSAGGLMEGNPDRTIATHNYAKPAGCGDLPVSGRPTAGLPVTGRSTAVIAVGGLLVVLLGVASLLLTRRRGVSR